MKIGFWLSILIMFVGCSQLHAQAPDSLQQWLQLPGAPQSGAYALQDSILLDSQLVMAARPRLASGQPLADSCWRLAANYLILEPGCLSTQSDSLLVDYEVLPLQLQQPRFRKNRNLIGKKLDYNKEILIGRGYSYNPFSQQEEATNYQGLEYSGSFARGISVGNRQDLILNSSFNLQLGGKIGDVEITGAVSDNNIPLQPQGNTQQIQDFDRIYLQFKIDKTSLLAGDYDLKRPEGSYFLNYYRRLQGGQFETGFKLTNDAEVKLGTSVAISRGNFARNVFVGEEGNQGPYRLRGNNGEVFIIILAGTERVFIDGQLLTRGTDNDYVIDYNLGEISFTNRQLITKDKRIQVEFSYSDLNYLRTIYTINGAYQQGKTNFRINWYSEQDAKNQPAQEALSDSAKAVLRRVGDNVDQAFTWGGRIPEEGDAISGLVKYKLIDTLEGGLLYDSVLVYSTNPDSAIYTVRFSQISTGGNYIRLNDAVNGTIYQWIAPDPLTGAPRGTHEPIELLVTPKQRQLLNVGLDYQINKRGNLSVDVAMSNNDLNTFSEVGNNDNRGLAGRITFNQDLLVGDRLIERDSGKSQKVSTILKLNAHYEALQNRFEIIEPYRPREFSRDWTSDFDQNTNEHLFRLNTELVNTQWGSLGYEVGGLLKDSLYQGIKQAVFTRLRWKGFSLISNASLLNAERRGESSQFLRPKADLNYQIKPLGDLKIGLYFEQEQNQRRDLAADTLLASSIYYNVFKAYAELPASERLSLKGSALRRYDYSPAQQGFRELTVADEINFAGNWEASRASQLEWNLNYRNLQISDTTRTTQTIQTNQTTQINLEPKETYVGRVEYNLNIRKGFIRLNTIYELGAGQQQRVAYNYLEVDKGQGTHVWLDRNEDGVQQQNEFEEANFQDQANFIRVTLLTGEFIRSNNLNVSQSVDIRPSVFFQRGSKADSSGWNWLGRIATRSLLKIDRKTLPTDEVLVFNPFDLNVNDTALVSVGSNIRNILYINRSAFNRQQTKYRLEIQQSDVRTKTLLNIGFDTRRRTDYSFLGVYKITKNFRSQLQGAYGWNNNASEFFPDRDYEIEFYEIQPEFSFLQKVNYRAKLFYKYKNAQNNINNQESAISHDVTAEFKFSSSKKHRTNIRLSFSWVNLAFDGDNNTPVQFAMTDGLQNGQNFLWNVGLDRSLSRNIQLSLNYEGRKTGDAPVVHVGRAQIRALF